MEYVRVYPGEILTHSEESFILLIEERETQRQVPLLVDWSEGVSFIIVSNGSRPRRPLSHNLIDSLMDKALLQLKQVTIDRFEEGIFYATLHVGDGLSSWAIDSRPGDAVVMALLRDCPILMEKKVLEETFMLPGALRDSRVDNADADGRPEDRLEELEALLRHCEAVEDYEQAAEILKEINRIKGIGT